MYRSSNPSAVDDPNSIINACGPEGEEIRGKRWKLHNEELHKLSASRYARSNRREKRLAVWQLWW